MASPFRGRGRHVAGVHGASGVHRGEVRERPGRGVSGHLVGDRQFPPPPQVTEGRGEAGAVAAGNVGGTSTVFG